MGLSELCSQPDKLLAARSTIFVEGLLLPGNRNPTSIIFNMKASTRFSDNCLMLRVGPDPPSELLSGGSIAHWQRRELRGINRSAGFLLPRSSSQSGESRGLSRTKLAHVDAPRFIFMEIHVLRFRLTMSVAESDLSRVEAISSSESYKHEIQIE